jgi:hypothetical protein
MYFYRQKIKKNAQIGVFDFSQKCIKQKENTEE